MGAKSRMRLGFIFYKDKKMRNIFSHMYDCARVALKFSYFFNSVGGGRGDRYCSGFQDRIPPLLDLKSDLRFLLLKGSR